MRIMPSSRFCKRIQRYGTVSELSHGVTNILQHAPADNLTIPAQPCRTRPLLLCRAIPEGLMACCYGVLVFRNCYCVPLWRAVLLGECCHGVLLGECCHWVLLVVQVISYAALLALSHCPSNCLPE